MVSDGERSYVGFSYDNDIIHQAVVAPKRFSKDGYHLAPINSLHSSFTFFISRYRGLSTRRLKGYINLFVLTHTLNRILNVNEEVSYIYIYIYESLMGLKSNLIEKEVNDVPFPVDIWKIYNSLRKGGKII